MLAVLNWDNKLPSGPRETLNELCHGLLLGFLQTISFSASNMTSLLDEDLFEELLDN